MMLHRFAIACLCPVALLLFVGCPGAQQDAAPVATADPAKTAATESDDESAADRETEVAAEPTGEDASAETSGEEAEVGVDDNKAETIGEDAGESEASEDAAEKDAGHDGDEKDESETAEVAPASENTGDNKIMLGSPELTAGIPGEGPLTVEEIKQWLAEPKNTDPLDFVLPLGLSAGAAQVKGLKENPLTRAKIELGRQLYFDTRLSADNTISCASCHAPDTGWARPTQFGEGIRGQKGGRNTPVSFNRILSDAQFWDGRAASLEEQALGPIANPIEMGNVHETCVDALKEVPGYRVQFEELFGGVTIEAVGKAIATFERAVVTAPSAFDYYEQLRVFGEVDEEELAEDDPETYELYKKAVEEAEALPMSASAKNGRELFFNKAGCTACHVGPNLSDEKYHNIGVGMDAKEPDLGRFVISKDEKDRGAFKTPTIRNVAVTGPYMHDGSQATLEEVVEWYDKGGHPNPHLSDKIKKLNLTPQEKKDLVEFMKACSGDFPPVETARLPE